MASFFRKLNFLERRRQKEAELQEELQFHLQEEAEQRKGRGVAQETAQREARLSLGNIALLTEETRAAWSWTWLGQLLQDLRYTVRSMFANKAFTGLAMLSLALGIGANTAIFSFMDAILLRSLPVQHPESLVQQNETLFSSVFGYQGAGRLNLTVNEPADTANGEYVSGQYFAGLGQPAGLSSRDQVCSIVVVWHSTERPSGDCRRDHHIGECGDPCGVPAGSHGISN